MKQYVFENNFLEKLSLKDASKLSKERHNATRNPFIIYQFYDLLQTTINELGLAKM